MANKKVVSLKKAKKIVAKKVVKVVKRKKANVSPEKVFNLDILHYWTTGEKRQEVEADWALTSEGNLLHYTGCDDLILAIQDKNGAILVNGDEYEWDDDREGILNKLQRLSGVNTTSFKCFEKAGIELQDIEVIDSQSDLNQRIMKTDKRFANAEKNVPKGATLTINRNFNKRTSKYTGAIWMKRIHRAGAILVKAKGSTYIASMDEEDYYIIELSKPAKTLVAAFKALKPAKVRTWEKKNKADAQRQGEWYFIPAPKVKIDDEKAFQYVALPMKSSDSNAHTCDSIQEIKKKQYVSGRVEHTDHNSVTLEGVHEAIENTAINSWSVEGVD